MPKTGFSHKHGGISIPFISIVFLGMLLFSVPPGVTATAVDNTHSTMKVVSIAANTEYENSLPQYEFGPEAESDWSSSSQEQLHTYTPRPSVSVADCVPFHQDEAAFEEVMSLNEPLPLGDIVHGSIDIDDDGDFAGQGWPGGGIEGNPYRIENLLIDKGGAAGHCISIRNTQVYFTIKNCTILGASTSSSAGIFFNYVENGRIEGCDFTGNDYDVWINGSSDCTIYDSFFGSNRAGMVVESTGISLEESVLNAAGFQFWECDYCEVNGCVFDGMLDDDEGLYIEYSSHFSVENCEFKNFADRAVYYQGLYATLTECNFTDNDLGLLLNVYYSLVSENYFENNTRGGMRLSSHDSTISNNEFYGNGDYAMWASFVNDTDVLNNIIVETDGPGIDGWDGVIEYSLFQNNTCLDNGYGMLFDSYANLIRFNTLQNNNCSYNSFDGIFLEACEYNVLEDNTCTFNGQHGIVLYADSNFNTLVDNYCSSNRAGILLEDSCDENLLEWNTCHFCDVYGICLIDSSENSLEQNAFFQAGWDGIAILNLSELNELVANVASSCVISGFCVNGTGGNILRDGDSDYSDYGIRLDTTDDNVVTNNTCDNNDAMGIAVEGSGEGNVISENTCEYNGDFGILLANTMSYSSVERNLCTGNSVGIFVYECSLNSIANNTCVSNSGHGIYVDDTWSIELVDNNCTDAFIGIYAYQSDNIDVISNWIKSTTLGISLQTCVGPDLAENVVHENSNGLYMLDCSQVEILYGNYSNNADEGLGFEGGNDIVVRGCNINGNGFRGMVFESSNMVVEENTISGNQYGIEIMTNEAVISDNLISDNTAVGIGIGSAYADSSITFNAFVDNTENAIDDGITNYFEFNYWSDYAGVDGDGDGIGDTIHPISGTASNNDSSPLVYLPGAPVLVEEATDQVVEYGSNLSYDLDATSASPLKGWSVDDTDHFSISNNGVVTNIVALELTEEGYSYPWRYGEYPLAVTVENIYNYTTVVEFTVFCYDTVSPAIAGPDDFSYEEGTTGHTIRWNASDLSLTQYGIWVYDIEGHYIDDYFGDFNNTDEFVEINIDGLEIGVYNFTMEISDYTYNWAYDTVIVTVTEAGGTTAIEIPLEMFLLIVGGIGAVVLIGIGVFIGKRRR